MTRIRICTPALLVMFALVGCGTAPRPTSPALSQVVDASLSAPGNVRSATGPMDLSLAAAATAVPASMLRVFLSDKGFRTGYSRVWSVSGELTSALDYRFSTSEAASAFVSYIADRLATSAYHQPFADPALPGSRGFELVSRVRDATQFCTGELFAVDADAFVLTRCAPYPLGPSSISALAQRQYAHAMVVLS